MMTDAKPKEDVQHAHHSGSREVFRWLFAGASAGVAVDFCIYPLDTLKTRMQSKLGFQRAGGFRQIYRGLSSVAMGSAPSTALFFLTYSSMKEWMMREEYRENPIFDAVRASCGELAALLVRVPTELVKQRAQVSFTHSTVVIARNLYKREGFRGFYRGYVSTVYREVPFAFLEFPLWEYLKRILHKKQGKPCTPLESALCGAFAGSVAAIATSPLDMAKTRIMLMETHHDQPKSSQEHIGAGSRENKIAGKGPGRPLMTPPKHIRTPSVPAVIYSVWQEEGFRRLYSGVVPRTLWISTGGFIFFFGYEFAMKLSHKLF